MNDCNSNTTSVMEDLPDNDQSNSVSMINPQLIEQINELVDNRVEEVLNPRSETYHALLRDLHKDLRLKEVNSRFNNISHKMIIILILMLLLWYFPRDLLNQ